MKTIYKLKSFRFGIFLSPEFGENKSPPFGQQIKPRKWNNT